MPGASPGELSLGSHCGKQSRVSLNVRFRTITLSTPWIRRLPPVIPAPRPRPTIVVFAVTGRPIVAVCLFADAARASSSGPDGSRSRPHTAGS